MTDRAASLVATLRTTETAPGIAPSTVVALPPSDDDPAIDEMRVAVDGSLITRHYDPELEQP